MASPCCALPTGRAATCQSPPSSPATAATCCARANCSATCRCPAAALTARTAFRQLSLSAVGRSAALVIARRDAGGGTVVTVTASVPHPVQLRFPAPPAPAEALAALDAAVDAVGSRYLDDVHGAGPWRAAMTRRLIAEALEELAR